MTKEDHETPSNAELIADDPNDPYEEQGYYLTNHQAQWFQTLGLRPQQQGAGLIKEVAR